MANKDALLSALLDEQKQILEGLVQTPAPTLEDYNRRVGQHIGLQKAIDIMLDLMRAGERDDG